MATDGDLATNRKLSQAVRPPGNKSRDVSSVLIAWRVTSSQCLGGRWVTGKRLLHRHPPSLWCVHRGASLIFCYNIILFLLMLHHTHIPPNSLSESVRVSDHRLTENISVSGDMRGCSSPPAPAADRLIDVCSGIQ